jgi:hypothetical protein
MGSFVNQPDFATRLQEISPTDDMNVDTHLNKAAIYIGAVPTPGTGTLAVMMPDKSGVVSNVVIRGLSAGMFLPICVDYVLDSGTTATRIYAYW